MKEINVKEIKNAVEDIFSNIAFKYEDSTKEDILKALDDTSNDREKSVLNLLLKNEDIAKENRIPLCQDTGMAIVVLEIGQDVSLVGGSVKEAINEGVRSAYKNNYLRYSVVDDPLFNRVNTKDNTPAIIHYELVEGDKLTIKCLAKGFGSENASKVIMLNPADGLEGVKNEVIKAVKEKGANACPPLTIGIGIGGTMDYAAYLSKSALLRNNLHSENELYKKLEIELKEEINKLNIGPAGLHGKNTCLKVLVEYYPTHIAGLPLAITINCHAVRKGEITL